MEDTEYDLMDTTETTMWWYRALHRRLVDSLSGVEGALLDAGCGTGGFLARVGAERPDLRAYGIDFFASAAARAGRKSGASTACASVLSLPFGDSTFNAVVSADVLCHAAVDPAVALAEFRRALKPGGRLVLNMPAFEWLKSAHDARVHNARRSTAADLNRLLVDSGFDAVRTRYWNSFLLPLMILERKVLASDSDAESDVKPFPPLVDKLLFGATELERRLSLPMPAGGSILAVARRR